MPLIGYFYYSSSCRLEICSIEEILETNLGSFQQWLLFPSPSQHNEKLFEESLLPEFLGYIEEEIIRG